jgi:hypothetical protein
MTTDTLFLIRNTSSVVDTDKLITQKKLESPLTFCFEISCRMYHILNSSRLFIEKKIFLVGLF